MLKHHKEETERQEQRLRERLDALGAGTSTRKQAQSIVSALLKGTADQVRGDQAGKNRSEEHTSELQSRQYLVCRLLLEKKKTDLMRTILHNSHAYLQFAH